MADVSTPIAAYKTAAPTWQLIEDACAGEAAVKAAGIAYLPKLNPQDMSVANRCRNEDYLKRAVYYNASGRTLAGLVGLAFAKTPEVEAPGGIDDVVANLDGAGTTLVQHMHGTLAEVVKTGRAGLLADFPKTDGKTSRAQEITGGVRPTVSYYPAIAVINWRTIVVGSQAKLSLVVLRETQHIYDGFGEKTQPQYRVLQLLEGAYTVQIWQQKQNEATKALEWVIADTFVPVGGNGQALTEIPFTFVGSTDNGWEINKAPMGDIATLNIAHYRNSADHEDSVFFAGQPTFWIAGLDVEWRDHLEKQGIYVGSRNVIPLPTNASAGVLQADPNTLVKEAMELKEKQMAALGARLIMADGTIKTATQQDSEDTIANSVLSLCCDNVSAAYTRALTWAADFANVTGKVLVTIHTAFTKFAIDPQELSSMISGVQQGLIPKSDLWARLRMADIIDPNKTDDDIREELDSEPVPGLAGGDGTDPPGGQGNGDPTKDPSGGDGGGDTTTPPAFDHKAFASTISDSHTKLADAVTKLTDAHAAAASKPPQETPPHVTNVTAPEVDVEKIGAAVAGALAPALGMLGDKIASLVQPPAQPPVINIAPAAITVEAPVVNVTPAAITVESPTVNIAPAAINMQPPAITVESPIVNVAAAQPAEISVPLQITVEGRGTVKTNGKMTENADGTFTLESTAEPEGN